MGCVGDDGGCFVRPPLAFVQNDETFICSSVLSKVLLDKIQDISALLVEEKTVRQQKDQGLLLAISPEIQVMAHETQIHRGKSFRTGSHLSIQKWLIPERSSLSRKIPDTGSPRSCSRTG
jgi:hypothetical protein